MNGSKKIKINDENQCPLARKRVKVTKTWKLISKDDDPGIIEQMGIGMLESSEESSSSGTPSVGVVTLLPSDENSNEATPNLDAPKLSQVFPENVLNSSIASDTTDNTSFIDPNETISSHTHTHKAKNANIEIYSDNKSLEKVVHKIAPSINNNTQISKNRSPLATVACNNNHTNISQKGTTTANTDEQNAAKKEVYVLDENFFLYKNRQHKPTSGKDHFGSLSDEMILQIFKWLPKKTLIRCSFVCRRFYQLAQDESLWARLDLGGKTLRSGSLGHILYRGVIILRLAQSEIKHPIFDPEWIQMYPDFETKLQYLDLSMAVLTKSSLKMLLSKCRLLKKLSLEHVKLSDEICDEISKNIQLEALNLAMCQGLEAWSIRKMMNELRHLNSLNISWTWLNVEGVTALVDNVTPQLMRLNIAGCRKTMFDSHLSTLTERCTQLLELDLSDCTGLTSNAISVVCKFKVLEYLSLSRCYGISASSYMELSNLPSLTYLDVFGILSDAALETLEHTFPELGINKFIHSSVARPTVGTRRTSIWGLRTRD